MSLAVRGWLLGVLGAALVMLLPGCVAGGGGDYDGGVSVSYGADFYEPFGYEYGGWGPGYWVGPPRRGGGWHHRDYGGGRGPAYHPAAPSRSMPSIPSRHR
jgi:hypothetical protein